MRKGYERRINRGSRPEVLCRKGAPINPTKPTGKHPCRSLPINKVTGLRPATLLKMETLAQAPSSEPREIPQNTPQQNLLFLELYYRSNCR